MSYSQKHKERDRLVISERVLTFPSLPVVGYPVVLEFCAFALALFQVLLTWFPIDMEAPSHQNPEFLILTEELWISLTLSLWFAFFIMSIVLYRTIQMTPLPVLSVSLCAILAVLRAEFISQTFNSFVTSSHLFYHSAMTGIVVFILACLLEHSRSRRKIVTGLAQPSSFDRRIPQNAFSMLAIMLGLGVPLLFLPQRIRIIDSGILVVTPVSHFLIPTQDIVEVEKISALRVLLSSAVNFGANPFSALRIFRRGKWLPIVLSIRDRNLFIEKVNEIKAKNL